MIKKYLKGLAITVGAFAFALIVGVQNSLAVAIDYASSSGAVDDATSGLTSVMISNSLKVIGIALSVWALFWAVGKLRKHTK
jgi:hypothetical protein